MCERARALKAEDFRDASEAADYALEAAMIAHDVILVVALAMSTETGALTLKSQEAVRTVAQYGVDKAQEARNAVDLAGGMFRAPRGRL
jgi:hypothetical protein